MSDREFDDAAGPPGPPQIGAAPGPDPAGATPPTAFLSLYSEKRPGRGEDAEALAGPVGDGACVVGVFDGLGGSGAALVETAQGQRTAAYLAARLARRIVLEAVGEFAGQPPGPGRRQAGRGDGGEWLRDRLADRLRAGFRARQEELGASAGGVRSSLIRPLPTTLAVGVVRPTGSAQLELDVFWAGDSRVYLLEPDAGLRQLTVDDLRSGGDAMRNLVEDSRMSNLVSADGRFQIHLARVALTQPAVVIAATDGCFGYVRTPAQFEDLLLTSMLDAAAKGSWEVWAELLRDRIVEIAGDDATMGIACLGWGALPDMAADFAARHARIAGFLGRLDRARAEVERTRSAAEAAKTALDEVSWQLWDEYRGSYEALLPPTEGGG